MHRKKGHCLSILVWWDQTSPSWLLAKDICSSKKLQAACRLLVRYWGQKEEGSCVWVDKQQASTCSGANHNQEGQQTSSEARGVASPTCAAPACALLASRH